MRRISARAIAAVTIVLAIGVGSTTPIGAAVGGGRVLPPQARPFGFTLADMTREAALFTQTGNDPANYPNTPFQILFVDPATFEAEEVGGCLHVTGTNQFTTSVRSFYFVPILNLSDVPPIQGEFPTTPAEARAHFFDADQVGGQYEIVVDGSATAVGPQFVAGPVAAPLESVGGSRMTTLGVFLAPFRPGTHTVVIRGTLTGAHIQEDFGAECVTFEFTYTVNVVRGRSAVPFG